MIIKQKMNETIQSCEIVSDRGHTEEKQQREPRLSTIKVRSRNPPQPQAEKIKENMENTEIPIQRQESSLTDNDHNDTNNTNQSMQMHLQDPQKKVERPEPAPRNRKPVIMAIYVVCAILFASLGILLFLVLSMREGKLEAGHPDRPDTAEQRPDLARERIDEQFDSVEPAESYSAQNYYPTNQQLQQLRENNQRNSHVLKQLNIKYKNPEREETREGDLSGLQMEFQNQAISPFFSVDDIEGDYDGTIELDTGRRIKYVSMGLRGGLFYTGIAFYDADEQLIAGNTWSENPDAKQTQLYEIPDDMGIVGFKCSTEGGNFANLALLLAREQENFVSEQLSIPQVLEFPQYSDFKTLYESNFKLSAINYKQYSDFYSLSGVQLEFSNGVQTPLFEPATARWDMLQSVPVDTERDIRYISLRAKALSYEGFRFYDENFEFILDLTWHLSPSGEWSEPVRIDEGKQIIGLRTNSFDDQQGLIFFLEFVLGPTQ